MREREEKKAQHPAGRNQTHDLESFAPQACALPLCYSLCPRKVKAHNFLLKMFIGGAGVIRFLNSDGTLSAASPPIQNQMIRVVGSDGAMQESVRQNIRFVTADGSVVSLIQSCLPAEITKVVLSVEAYEMTVGHPLKVPPRSVLL